MIHHHIQYYTDDFRIKAVIGAGQAAVQENGTIICSHILENLVASVQGIQIIKELSLISFLHQLAPHLHTDNGINGVIRNDSHGDSLAFHLDIGLETTVSASS